MYQSQRWRHKPTKRLRWFDYLSVPFVIIILISFLLMSGYALVNYIISGDKQDLLQNRLGTVAAYLRVYDKQTSELVKDIDTIIQSYSNKENIFVTQTETINRVRNQIVSQTETILKNNEQYSRLAYFLEDIHPHKEEILMYMGANVPKSYLVILQNSSERRPNGWFFWSFAYVRVLHGRIRTIHMIDSYLGYNSMPWISIRPPQWSDPIYGWVPFGWIASNKFGFTNIDGDYMIQLYNKTFNSPESKEYVPNEVCKDICHRPIDWVIFVQTDGLKKIMPWLERKTRERQFMNASVDLIRGANLPNKKEYYLTDSQNFFMSQSTTAVRNFISQFTSLTDKYTFGIYIPTISQGLNEVITKYNFTTIPNNHTLYSWDTNKSFNKIDEFVTKTITIRDAIGDILIEQMNYDHINIKELPNGSYTMEINYKISIPRHYKEYIKQLEENNNITLTDRELGILSLKPTIAEDGIQRFWESKSQLYHPNTVTITNITGDIGHTRFTSPFWAGIDYTVTTTDDNTTKQVFIDFTLQQ